MSKAPCINCAERRIGCHARCEKYLAWKTNIDKARIKKQHEDYINYNPHIFKKVRFITDDIKKW